MSSLITCPGARIAQLVLYLGTHVEILPFDYIAVMPTLWRVILFKLQTWIVQVGRIYRLDRNSESNLNLVLRLFSKSRDPC